MVGWMFLVRMGRLLVSAWRSGSSISPISRIRVSVMCSRHGGLVSCWCHRSFTILAFLLDYTLYFCPLFCFRSYVLWACVGFFCTISDTCSHTACDVSFERKVRSFLIWAFLAPTRRYMIGRLRLLRQFKKDSNSTGQMILNESTWHYRKRACRRRYQSISKSYSSNLSFQTQFSPLPTCSW